MSVKNTYFFAGAYGVGKSTLCETIAQITGIPEFSSSDIISGVNGEQYGANKFVNDKDLNQNILANRVNEILLQEKEIILSGHFCIFNKNCEVEELPEQVFSNLHIKKIILLEADIEKVLFHLGRRDNKQYSIKSINLLQQKEKDYAQQIALSINKPLLVHKMAFDDSDVLHIIRFIKE